MRAVDDIVKAVRSVVGPGSVALHQPSIGPAEQQALEECLIDNPVGYGALDRFQSAIARVCGTEQALLLSSGTAALHLALVVLGVKAGDEVIMPALSFVAPANAVSYCGAVPNFVDSREWDYGIAPFKLQRYLARICERKDGQTYNRNTGRRIKALIAVDVLGVPCAIDEIRIEADRWNLPVLEDAAEALGSKAKGAPCGGNANIGVVSFNANKIITTGGGGALLTNDAFLQARAWELATTARVGHPWLWGNHTAVAWNYRMPNINAALGLSQLARIDQLIEQKANLHKRYVDVLDIGVEGQHADGNRWNYWLNAFSLAPLDNRRDEICAALTAAGIACRTLFTPLNELPMYKDCPRDNLDGARDLWRSTICLPSSPHLGVKP